MKTIKFVDLAVEAHVDVKFCYQVVNLGINDEFMVMAKQFVCDYIKFYVVDEKCKQLSNTLLDLPEMFLTDFGRGKIQAAENTIRYLNAKPSGVLLVGGSEFNLDENISQWDLKAIFPEHLWKTLIDNSPPIIAITPHGPLEFGHGSQLSIPFEDLARTKLVKLMIPLDTFQDILNGTTSWLDICCLLSKPGA